MRYCAPEGIRTMVRQVERWIRAAEQDNDPAIRGLHASYAVGNLDILRQVATDQEIVEASGVQPLSLLTRAAALQDAAAKLLQQRGGIAP